MDAHTQGYEMDSLKVTCIGLLACKEFERDVNRSHFLSGGVMAIVAAFH